MGNGWIRLIKNNPVNSLGIFIIVLLTVFLGTVFLESNQNLSSGLDKIKKGNVEDFTFYPSLTGDELMAADNNYSQAVSLKADSLANKYGFTWEGMNYKIIKKDKNIFRIYSSDRTINRLYLTKGQLPATGEAVVDYRYAKVTGIRLSDMLTVDSHTYKVSGICVFPDQLYPVVDNTGVLYDKTNQAILALSSGDYKSLEEGENILLAGKFLDATKNISDMEGDSDFYQILSSIENMQIYSSIQSQKVMNTIIMGFSMGILGSIALLLIVITITGQIRSELPNLGVLKALGYSNREISSKYLAYFIIVLIPAIIGYLAGHAITPHFYELICSRFEIPYSNYKVNIINLLLFSFCPAIASAFVAYLRARTLVRRPALNMIRDMGVKKSGHFTRRKNNRIREDKYLKGVRSIILSSNMLLFAFILFGGFALGVQIQFAYTTYNMTSNLSDKVLKGIHYQSDVRFAKTISGEDKENNLYYYRISGRLKSETGKTSNLYDVCALGEGREELLELFDVNGNSINLTEEDGLVINELMAVQNNLKIGDKAEFVFGEESLEIPVSAITQSTYGTVIYMNQKEALARKLITDTVYNGMFSVNTVSFDPKLHISISNVNNIKETINQSNSLYIILSAMLFILGLVIGATVLLLSIYASVSHYKKYIALMKIYGYTQKECNYTIINGYRKLSLAGFLVSIPYTYILCSVMFRIISMNSDMLYPVNFNLLSVLICFFITFALTELIIGITRRFITGISFKEIMEKA